MIYLISLIAGILNGFFASGAGHLIIFYLVFILKEDTYISRGVSIAVLTITSIFTFIRLKNAAVLEMDKIIYLIIISGLCGIIGSKIMCKINPKTLNLISGILVFSLAAWGLSR